MSRKKYSKPSFEELLANMEMDIDLCANKKITQQLFFGKQKEMKWNEIKSSLLSWEYNGHGANLGWVITAFSGKTMNLQASFYSRKKIQLIAEALVQKSNKAELDKRIINMADGKFPWYIF